MVVVGRGKVTFILWWWAEELFCPYFVVIG
jgi:hypothetical protein